MIYMFKVTLYYLLVYLRILETNVLKYMNWILLIFLSAPGLEVQLELLPNIDMLLMVEKGIRGGICHVIHKYAKANNKYMKNYDKNKE